MKQSLIVQKEKFLLRIKKDREGSDVRLPIQLDSSDKILICLPETNFDHLSLLDLLQDYQLFFSCQEIIFCAPTIFKTDLSTVKNGFYYDLRATYSRKKISALLKNQLKINSYKLAIDLNHEFSLIPALLCNATKAQIRLSFNKNNAQFFYNILVNNKTNNKTAKQLQQLLKEHLTSFVKQHRAKISQ